LKYETKEFEQMNWKEEYKPFLWMFGIFLFVYFLPVENAEFKTALFSAVELSK